MTSSKNLTFSPGFKRLLLLIASLSSLVGINRVAESFFAPEIYKKDVLSPYLMAKAILNGVNPYSPLPELANRWLSEANNYSGLNHPTPHTPFTGVLSMPLGLLSYKAAVIVWFVFELACLLAIVLLILRWWGTPIKKTSMMVLFLIALGWLPIIEDLWFGQFSICLLLLLLGAWLALREGNEVIGGGLLGGMIALKLMAWPIVLYLILRGKWRGVFAAGAVAGCANLLAILLLGKSYVWEYYFKVGPLIAAFYRSMDTNISAWTMGQRLFQSFGSNLLILPLWPSPSLATWLTYLIPLAVLVIGLGLALRATSFDTGFSVLVGVSILVSPIVWTHYLILAVIPIGVLARRLFLLGFPHRMSYYTFGLFLMLSVNNLGYVYFALLFSTHTLETGIPVVPFAAGLLTLIPAAALIGLLWILWRLDDVNLRQHSQREMEREALILPLS